MKVYLLIQRELYMMFYVLKNFQKLGNKAKKMIVWSSYSIIAFSNKPVWGSSSSLLRKRDLAWLNVHDWGPGILHPSKVKG